jgi:PAS domain S-box-containing protein
MGPQMEKRKKTKKKVQQVEGKIAGTQKKSKGRHSVRSPYDALLMASREATIIFKPTGEIVDINQAAAYLFGYSMGDMLGLNFRELHGSQQFSQNFQKQMGKEGSIRDLQIKLRRKDGKLIECQLNISAWKARDGSPGGYTAIVHDIPYSKVVEKDPGQSVQSWLAL